MPRKNTWLCFVLGNFSQTINFNYYVQLNTHGSIFYIQQMDHGDVKGSATNSVSNVELIYAN